MSWYKLTLQPRDVLFFRNARPMEASTIGEGANWPVPSVLHHALQSAFHQQWPNFTEWEHKHRCNDNDTNKNSSFRFGGLQCIGPFPEKDGLLYLPTPADLQYKNNETNELCVLKPEVPQGNSDLPPILKRTLFKPGSATKKNPTSWISIKNFLSYLQGNIHFELKEPELFLPEERVGIAIDPETETTEEGAFYLAEYMRLTEGTELVAFASCQQTGRVNTDVLEKYFEENPSPSIVMGGQQGVVHIRNHHTVFSPLEVSDSTGSQLIKWVLLTPALFHGGWLPNWINKDTGDIILYNKPPRNNGESRSAWRERINTETKAEKVGILVAACIPKPLVNSGWQLHGGNGNSGARPTRLCVPAGAVYYFEAPDRNKAGKLTDFLHRQCKSDMSAEKGFGFGVCGTWENKVRRL